MYRRSLLLSAIVLLCSAGTAAAAPADRVTVPVDPRIVRVLPGRLHHLATAQNDQGAVDPAMPMGYMLLMTRPSAAQQSDLDQLLADQQNPSSPRFHHWLTPEEFGARFGLTSGDRSRIAAWLQSEGFTIRELARGSNWIAFSGTAGQVSAALHTAMHRFLMNNRGKMETHYSNISPPSVPEALAGVVSGFIGLNDFPLMSAVRIIPDYTSAGSHYLAPQDFATIYDITPLYAAGLDGTGTSIAVVGASDYLASDLQAFQKRYGLPANTPKQLLYEGTDPGYTGFQDEVNLDLEWASAIAPKATIYFVNGPSALDALISAVNSNTAPIITSSYGACEVDVDPFIFQATGQQANAQGITMLNAIGDSGAAGCDPNGDPEQPYATQGQKIWGIASMPEVTAVGGTEFVEGTSTSYWSATNSSTLGSATSYIPETAWNESGSSGLGATGGGNSLFYPRPVWQTGPGVPNDNVRHVPDIAFTAAQHDGYEITLDGVNFPVSGTSAATPAFAGVVALLNQYVVTNNLQAKPGLGNINPQLYRLAQSMPSVFHDVVSGSNVVPCAQGSPDCLAGSFGFPAGAGYDMATGLGSIDVNALVTNWNTATNGVTVTLTSSAAKVTSNDMITLTATVAPASGAGTPTGTVAFSIGAAEVGVGAVPLSGGTASVTFPAYQLTGIATELFFAQYSGDAAFSSGGASIKIQVTAPTGITSIIPIAPNVVQALPADAQGVSWSTPVSLYEVAGVAAMLTGFTIDGQAQTLSNYFPQTTILPKGSISSIIVLRNLVTPMSHTFGFTGVDATGQSWSRQVSVLFVGAALNANVSVLSTPLTVTQNVAADPSCQWPVPLHVDDQGGNYRTIVDLVSGSIDWSSQIASIFGTTRLAPFGSLAGTMCFGGVKPASSEPITVVFDDGSFYDVTVSFADAPANPVELSAASANLTLTAAPGQPAQGSLGIGMSDPTQQWTASVFPANRTTAWLNLSQFSGAGPATVTVTATGDGFEPGAYPATIVLQSANALPQTVSIPVMMILGGSTSGISITGVANASTASAAASGLTTGAAGMLLTVTGTQLANSTANAPARTNPLPYTLGGVSAYVNGVAAPVTSISPNQLAIQIPYEVGAGPAVLGINNNGQIAGFQFQIASSAPGIYDDGKGNLAPTSSAKAGATVTVSFNGAGDVGFSTLGAELLTANLPSASTGTIRPLLPVSVTVGGVQAFLQTTALSTTVLGETQATIVVPATVAPGPQPVVVTVGGVASQAVNLTVQ